MNSEKAMGFLIGVVCSIVAATGVGLLTLGFGLVGAAIWIQTKMED